MPVADQWEAAPVENDAVTENSPFTPGVVYDDQVYDLDDLDFAVASGHAEDKMAVYIAGPMTNQPQFNYPAFDALEEILTQEGFVVASPARLDAQETRRQALTSPDGAPGSGSLNGETWGDFLARDVKVISDIVDGVVLMPGWEKSSGARLEAFIARHVGKPVFYSNIGTGGGRYAELHEKICLCSETMPWRAAEPAWYDIPLVELDDAELDYVLTQADVLTLMKIEQDEVRQQTEVPPFDVSFAEEIKEQGILNTPGAQVNATGGSLTEEDVNRAIQYVYDSGGPKVKTTDIADPPADVDPDYLPQDGKATNPKDAIGSGKIPLHLWPQTATILGSLGLLDGMLKYGRSNWRAAGVRASIYVDAVQRHMGAWFEGEDLDPDSGLPHPAHALACLAIIVDAQAAGMLNDDRQFNGSGYRPFIDGLTDEVAKAKERHADKDPKHYTKDDNE